MSPTVAAISFKNDHIRLRCCSQLELIQLVLYMSSFEIYERDDCDGSHAQIYMSIWLVDFHRDLSMRAHFKYIRVTNVIVLTHKFI